EAALHVGSAASKQHAVPDLRREGVAAPLLERTGRHHIGVPREAKQGTLDPAPRPQVVDRAEAQVFHAETDGLQPFAHQALAAAVGRAHRGARDELAGQRQGARGLAARHQNRSIGGRRLRLFHTPQAPRPSAAISTQAGMASPSSRQSTLWHSPEPESTLTSTSLKGNSLSMKSSDAPQAGTLPGGRL